MNRRILHGLLAAAALLWPVSIHAQAFRAYLSSHGSDNPACSVSTPCRLLPAALDAVADNGEIWILDSANFNSGTVTVDKNVVIQAIPGEVGSIAPSSGTPAMLINPGLRVTLRNISMVTSAASPGSDGIHMTTGSLDVEDSVFEVRGTNASSPNGTAIQVIGAGSLSVRRSVFRSGRYSILAGAGAKLDVSDSRFEDVGNGLPAGAGVFVVGDATTTRATVTRSEFVNSNVGVWVFAAGTAIATVTRCAMSHNTYGLAAQASSTPSSATISASGNNISNNVTGVGLFSIGASSAAVFQGMGDNVIRNSSSANTSLNGAGASMTTFAPL